MRTEMKPAAIDGHPATSPPDSREEDRLVAWCAGQINAMYPEARVGGEDPVRDWLRRHLFPQMKGYDEMIFAMAIGHLRCLRALQADGWSPRCSCGEVIYLFFASGQADSRCYDCINGGQIAAHPGPPCMTWEESIRAGIRRKIPELPPDDRASPAKSVE